MVSQFFKGCYILLIINVIYVQAYLIGEPCRYDEECFVEHSFCEMQQICQCKANFVETEDRETCIAMVGAYCHSKYDCSSLPNSICKDEKCQCDNEFISDPASSRCIPVSSHLESRCELDVQCAASYGRYSYCNRGICNCTQNYHFDGRNCTISKGMGQICRSDSECFIGEAYRGTVGCNGGTCGCRQGYYLNEARVCQRSGSTILKTPLNLVILLITFYIYGIQK